MLVCVLANVMIFSQFCFLCWFHGPQTTACASIIVFGVNAYTEIDCQWQQISVHLH